MQATSDRFYNGQQAYLFANVTTYINFSNVKLDGKLNNKNAFDII